MISKTVESSFKKYAEEMLACRDLHLFRFRVFARGRISVFRLIIDHAFGGVTIDECACCNKLLRVYLEEQQVPGEDFEIEVFSPGADMKLKSYPDFKRVTGKTVLIWLDRPWNDKTYIEGVLKEAEKDHIVLEGGERIPSRIIKCAKQRIEHE